MNRDAPGATGPLIAQDGHECSELATGTWSCQLSGSETEGTCKEEEESGGGGGGSV